MQLAQIRLTFVKVKSKNRKTKRSIHLTENYFTEKSCNISQKTRFCRAKFMRKFCTGIHCSYDVSHYFRVIIMTQIFNDLCGCSVSTVFFPVELVQKIKKLPNLRTLLIPFFK